MLSLIVELRQIQGKKNRTLREEKFLPGVVYGKEIGNLPIKIPSGEFKKIYHQAGESVIINLKIKQQAGGNQQADIKEYPVLIREVQHDPVFLEIIHVDFYQIPTDREIEMSIPLEFVGEAPAEKELGGILIKNIHEVKVKTLPQNLVYQIKVELSSVKTFEDRIKIKDLKIPSGINILASGDEIVVLARKFEEEKFEEAPPEMKLEEVEVVKKEKKEKVEGGEGAEEEKAKEGKKSKIQNPKSNI